ncbi:MAG: hypothetical protein IPL26_28595 [Leptospiraceae bacterium]|nr:hypothetical protein [Leptospiraceae bacterium]
MVLNDSFVNFEYVGLVLLCAFLNCISMPPTSNLRSAEKQKNKILKTIVIERTTIPELLDEDRKDIEDELTINIRDFLEEGNYFDKVLLFTEKDSSLKRYESFQFHFLKYSHTRRAGEAGSKKLVDSFYYECILTVTNEKNKILHQIHKNLQEEKTVRYSNGIPISHLEDTRTKLITDILDEYQKLSGSK